MTYESMMLILIVLLACLAIYEAIDLVIDEINYRKEKKEKKKKEEEYKINKMYFYNTKLK